MRLVFVVFTVSLICCNCNGDSEDFRQEAAKVVQSDPDYIKEIKLLTYRQSRQSPYLTYANCTLVHPWENNITVLVDCYNARTKQEIFSLDFKLCEVIKVSWAKEWLKVYSNISPQCPIPVTTLSFTDVEIPPKNFPIPLPPGDYTLGLAFALAKTKHKVLELKVNLKAKKMTFGR